MIINNQFYLFVMFKKWSFISLIYHLSISLQDDEEDDNSEELDRALMEDHTI